MPPPTPPAGPVRAPAPPWLAGRTLYQLHVLGAAGVAPANPDVSAPAPAGDGLARLVPWLDSVADLGCGAVLLTPIFVSRTHGYDTVDPFRIDQRLGDDAEFDRFVDACHRRDLHLLLDGVFNHVGRDFAPFRDVVDRGRASAWARWFRLDFDRDEGDGFAYATFEGHRELVALNHLNPEVLDWAGDVTRRWTDRGVDGWRLDAAYAIPRRFLAALVERIHGHRADAFVFGEVIHGDYARFVAGAGLDSVTQYELHKAIWSSLNDANLFELAWALQRHRDMLATFPPVTFVGNHDVTRIASQLRDPGHLDAALAILFGVGGTPCVYYGDEHGWTGVKEHRPGGDDAIRPPLAAPPPAAGDPRDLHARLIGLRRARPWLTGADIEVEELSNTRAVLVARAGGAQLRTTIDLTDPRPEPPGDGAVPLLSGAHVQVSEIVPGWGAG